MERSGYRGLRDTLQARIMRLHACLERFTVAYRFWWRDTRLSELSNSPPPSSEAEPTSSQYRFSYPTTLLPIPYHTDLSLSHLSATLVPLSRSTRNISISVPIQVPLLNADDMKVEIVGTSTKVELRTEKAQVKSDGMLLYVAQATYEPGTSPLSLWIPIRSYSKDAMAMESSRGSTTEDPLDTFER